MGADTRPGSFHKRVGVKEGSDVFVGMGVSVGEGVNVRLGVNVGGMTRGVFVTG